MREYSTKDGPYPIRLHYEPAEIDQICENALRFSKLLPQTPEPIRIERFLEKHFEVPVVYDQIEPGIMGCTVFESSGRVSGFIISPEIETNGTKSEERRARSTLAHEGGHGLLHPKLFMTGPVSPSLFSDEPPPPLRILCRSNDIGPAAAKPRYSGQWWEWQANRAISGLLLPRKLTRLAAEPFFESDGLFHPILVKRRSEAVASLAETFDVNPVVVRIRLDELYPVSDQLSL
jgi:hypothetical protein